MHPPAFVLAVASYHYPSGQLHCVTRVAPAGPEILTPVQAMQSDLTAFTFALYVPLGQLVYQLAPASE